VPARSVAQGLAALAVHDPSRAFADDLVGMASAAAATRTIEVEVEVEVETGAGPAPVRGRLDGAVLVNGDDPFTVAAELLDRVLIAGGDLVTLVTGDGADELGDRLRAYLAATRPHVEVHHHRGGAASTPLVAGVE
jgi:dihydroxyacetone kinase-like predicted kinase